MEQPLDGSWGDQVTSFYAPSARHGAPQDLMFLVDTLHQNGFGSALAVLPARPG